ncbi:MAG: SGNH/GDSL hydrolase family protein [Micromonosporaceae bacterium]
MTQWQTFVVVGDSFTEGLDDPDGAGGYRGWADLVASRLAAPGFRYANLAVRGKLLDDVVAEQLPAAVAMAPELVSFAAGGNDVMRRSYRPAAVRVTLDDVIGKLTATGAQVLMFTAADVTTTLPRSILPRVLSFNDTIREVAASHGATLVDLWSDDGFGHVRMWSEDRLHLGTLGHRRVAANVLAALGVAYPQVWRAAPAPVRRTSWLADRRADLKWARLHLAPWVHRRLTGRSSGDGRQPKRPQLAPLEP